MCNLHQLVAFSCFSSHFCIMVFLLFFLFVFSSLSLFLAVVNSLSLIFLVYSSNPSISVTRRSSMLTSSLHPTLLNSYRLPLSSLECKTLCIVFNFLVIWSIYQSSSFVHWVQSAGTAEYTDCISTEW